MGTEEQEAGHTVFYLPALLSVRCCAPHMVCLGVRGTDCRPDGPVERHERKPSALAVLRPIICMKEDLDPARSCIFEECPNASKAMELCSQEAERLQGRKVHRPSNRIG